MSGKHTPPRLWVEVFLWRQGLIWFLVPLLLITALVLFAFDQLKLQPEMQLAEQVLAQTEANLRAANRNATNAATRLATNERTPQQALEDVLISSADVTAIVRDMHAIALHHELRVLSSDFQLQASGVDGIARQTVSMPFQASYQQFKRFLMDVLRNHPGVSVDQVSIKREASIQGRPEVLVKFSIWTKAGPSPTGTTSGALQ